jgi:hypothetical protein
MEISVDGSLDTSTETLSKLGEEDDAAAAKINSIELGLT